MKIHTAYADHKGELHTTPEAATRSDIAAIFGPSCEGMATGIARTILDNRRKLEALFAELDTVKPTSTHLMLWKVEGKAEVYSYGDWRIEYNPKPIPSSCNVDWDWTHKDYDGEGDTRHGNAADIDSCTREIIDWYIDNGIDLP